MKGDFWETVFFLDLEAGYAFFVHLRKFTELYSFDILTLNLHCILILVDY